jgi:hypothetical protein
MVFPDTASRSTLTLSSRATTPSFSFLQAECAVLPEQSNEETYEAMPIEMFGEAMLRGMG